MDNWNWIGILEWWYYNSNINNNIIYNRLGLRRGGWGKIKKYEKDEKAKRNWENVVLCIIN